MRMRKRKGHIGVAVIMVALTVVLLGILRLRPPETETVPEPVHFSMAEFPTVDPFETTIPTVAKVTEEMQGVWISYLEFESILMGKNEEAFRKSLTEMFENCTALGLNTVIVQVRSHGDSYYPSDYYPWSVYASGTAGQSPGFDPFAVVLEEAKKKGLDVHAWINPYRLGTEQQMEQLPKETILKTWYADQSHMKKQDGYYYLDPGNKEVQTLICNGVKEIVTKYEVDGIQIDDYFYVVKPAVFDQSEQEARAFTTELVKALHQTVKAKSKDLAFGISPMGNYKEVPISDTEQYTQLQEWCEKGYVDYLAPQIYWDFDDDVAPFAEILTKWESMLRASETKLYVGLANYKFDKAVIDRQIDAVQNSKVASGYLLFRYDYLVE